MADHTRDGKIVVDLTMGARTSWTTTRDYFTQDDFTALRDGMKKMEGSSALQHLKEGKELTAAEKTLLKTHLGKFSEDKGAVNFVADFMKGKPANAVPESLVREGGHALVQSDIRDAAQRLAKQGDKAAPAVETMRDIAAGKTVDAAARTSATKVFKEAGLLNGRDEVSIVGSYLLKQEGKAVLAAAGVKAAVTAVDAGIDASKIASGVAKTGAVKAVGSSFAKKIPLLGTALGVVTTMSAMSTAASAAEIPAVTGSTPQEIERAEMQKGLAEMKRTAAVVKEGVIGAVGLLPVPGADLVLRAQMDRSEAQLQAQYDRAQNPHGRETIDYDKLIFMPEERGGLSGDFNAASPRLKVVMAAPEHAHLPAPVAKVQVAGLKK